MLNNSVTDFSFPFSLFQKRQGVFFQGTSKRWKFAKLLTFGMWSLHPTTACFLTDWKVTENFCWSARRSWNVWLQYDYSIWQGIPLTLKFSPKFQFVVFHQDCGPPRTTHPENICAADDLPVMIWFASEAAVALCTCITSLCFSIRPNLRHKRCMWARSLVSASSLTTATSSPREVEGTAVLCNGPSIVLESTKSLNKVKNQSRFICTLQLKYVEF